MKSTLRKEFECDHCGASGHVNIYDDGFSLEDIICCPICGSDISDQNIDGDDSDTL
jgi:transcription elongation factor Elf1